MTPDYFLVLCITVLLLATRSCCLGQGEDLDLLSGSGTEHGDEDEMVDEETTEMTYTHPFVRLYCQSFPKLCARSVELCPCGSIVDKTLLDPNYFRLLQLFPCPNSLLFFKECDQFIERAAIFAIDSLRSPQGNTELEYLYLACFSILYDPDGPDDLATAFKDFEIALSKMDSWIGIVGPGDTTSLEMLQYIAGSIYHVLTISYSSSIEIEEETRDKYPYLYSTVPSPSFFIKVTLQLLSDFQWRRVGVLSSRSALHTRNSELLLKFGSRNKSYDFLYLNAFDDDPSPILEQFKADDFRIFVANVDSSSARILMCKALRLNLTTPLHQWIFPSFYDHRWWHSENDSCSSEEEDDCCSNDEILDASLGIIFVGESTIDYGDSPDRTNTALNVLEEIFDLLIKAFKHNPDSSDKLYLLHSKALYAYDATNLLTVVFNQAMRELFNSSTASTDTQETCKSITSPTTLHSNDVLLTKMDEILKRSAFCGYSGYFVLGNSSTFGKAWITQFQYYEDCIANSTDIGSFKQDVDIGCYKETDIGHYANIDATVECERFKLQPASQLSDLDPNHFRFTNSCCGKNHLLITSGPYIWKGDNPWKPPTDGACHDESCLCQNQLGFNEFITGCVVTSTGVLLCSVVLFLNFLLRNTKHLKAASPRLNILIIAGCGMIYLIPVFRTVSLTGNYFGADLAENLIPSFCEVDKWLGNIGFSLVLSALVARNWRIYRIFFNPRIKERKFLSDFWIFMLTLTIVLPVVILVVVWTVLDRYTLLIKREDFSCPDLGIDDSISTFRVTWLCHSKHRYLFIIIIRAYQIILGSFLLFLGYKNSTISSHFAQEGEFASKSMLFIMLVVIPMFLISVVVLESSGDLYLIFQSSMAYVFVFPTLILAALYLPKFVLIVVDKRNLAKGLKTTQLQMELQQQYKSKIDEIEDIKTRLRSRQGTLGSATITIEAQQFNTLNTLMKSATPSPLSDYEDTFSFKH